MNKNASVDPNTMWCLLLYSMRYSMGRTSSSPSDVSNWIRRYRKYLSPRQIEQIAEEIETELQIYERQGRLLGHQCDHNMWTRLVADLRA